MGYATAAAFRAAMAVSGIRLGFTKSVPATAAAGQLSSFWASAGAVSGIAGGGASWAAGSAPGTTATAPTRSTTGALPFPLASASKVRYLGRAAFGSGINVGANAQVALLFDRLLHCGGLSGTSTSAQTVGGASVPSRGSNDVHEIYLEWYTATGATTANATVVYTEPGNTQRTCEAVALPASVGAGRMVAIPLYPGDTQVKTIDSVTLDASTGTAGSFGVTVVRRVAAVCPARFLQASALVDGISLGLPKIDDTSCLFFAQQLPATSVFTLAGQLWFPDGDP